MEFEYFIPWSVRSSQNGTEHRRKLPAADAVRELVFAAHYDSKTDFFDHIEPAKVYRFIPIAGVLGMLMSLVGAASQKVRLAREAALSIATVCVAGALSV